MNNNINDNISFYYKYLNYDKKNNIRNTIDKNNSAPNIFLHNSNNSSQANRKKFISYYIKKISNEQNGNSTNHLTKKNDYNFYSKDNSFNNAKNINNNYSSKNNLKKVPFNITNNAFNINKNNINISLNTSILGDNLNLVQQKLSEYKNFIYKKIDQLMKDKKTKIIQNRNRSCQLEKKKVYSPKTKFYKKITKVISSSDLGRNKKNINDNFSNTYYKNISNESIKNKYDKITIVPIRLKDYEQKIIYNPIMNKENVNKNKFKKIIKNNTKGKIYLDSYNEMINKKNIY